MIAATDQLHVLADEVDGLGATARQALTQVVAGDVDELGTTIATGTDQVGTVQGEAAELDALLAAVPGVASNPELTLSEPMIRALRGADRDARRDRRPRDRLGRVLRARPQRGDPHRPARPPRHSRPPRRRRAGLGGALPAGAGPARRVRRDDRAGARPPRRPRRLDRRLDADDVDRPQRRLRRRAAPAVRRAAGVEGPGDRPGPRGLRGRAGGPAPAAAGHPRARRDHVRHRPGRAQPGGDLDRGGTRRAVVGARPPAAARSSRPSARLGAIGASPSGPPPVHWPASFQPHPACRGRSGPWMATREDPSCRSALSPTSRGRSRPTSSSCPSSASSSSRAPTTSSTGDPAASCARSRRSASCAIAATGRRSARPASSRRGGCSSSRPATPRTSTARPRASSPPARSGA